MNTWVDILRGTLVVICHSLSLYLMSEPRSSLKHPVAYWIAVSMAAEILTVPMFIFHGYTAFSGGIVYVILLLIYLTAYLYASSGMFLKNFSVFLFYVVFFMLSAAVSDLTVRLAFGEDFPVLIILIRTLFSVVYIILYPTILKDFIRKATDGIEQGWVTIIVFEFIAFIAISLLSFMGAFFLDDITVYLLLLTMMTVLIISSYCVVLGMLGLLNGRNDNRAMAVQHGILRNEMQSEKEYIDSTAKFRHEIKQHDRVILSYLNDGRSSEAMTYIREFDVTLDRPYASSLCSNSAINALLRMTARRMSSIGGKFYSNAVIPEKISISRPDIAVIFGCLLENAYEASSASANPEISVTADISNESLYAEVRNSMIGTIVWNDYLPRSTKENGGTGLRNVESILGGYGGMMNLEQSGDTFIARVIIPV